MNDILHDDRRATEVIQRMRSLLKKAPFEQKQFDLNEVVQETIRFFSSLAVGRKFELVSVITPDALPILGDRIQLQQVILNLVVNGIEAMRDTPSENRIISIRTSRVENFAQLSVSDRGSGIPEDKLKAGLRTVFHQQGGRHGHGAVHRAHHYRGAPWADIGKKSGSRRCVVPDQASSCPIVASPVTATTDFLAPDILNKCGRAFPAGTHALHRTLTTERGGTIVLWRSERKSELPRSGLAVAVFAS